MPARPVAHRRRPSGCRNLYLGAASSLLVNLGGRAWSLAAISDALSPLVVGGATITTKRSPLTSVADVVMSDSSVKLIHSMPVLAQPTGAWVHRHDPDDSILSALRRMA